MCTCTDKDQRFTLTATQLQTRADAYRLAFPQYPDSHLQASDRWLQGMWLLGNNYQGSGMYGAYPPGYLKRVLALFGDAQRVLHLCSGSLPRQPAGHVTLDSRVTGVVRPSVCGNGHHLPLRSEVFDLVLADPPYSAEDAKQYGTGMVNRPALLREAWRVTRPGGHLVWLDTQVPMFSKVLWHWWGAITIIRSTNHRVRLVSLFERV